MLYLPYILILLPMASAFALRPAAAQGRTRAEWVKMCIRDRIVACTV